MKKTSFAVWALLLLSCANATITATDPGYSSATINILVIAADDKAGLLLQGKPRVPLRASKNPVYLLNAADTVVGTDIASSIATGGRTVETGTTSCLKCIKNVDAITNTGVLTSVWRSDAWNYSYEIIAIAATALYPHTID